MKLFPWIIIAVVTPSCVQQDKSQSEAVKHSIAKLIEADNRADIESVLRCYSDNAVLVPPGKPMIEGREAIRANYEGIFSKSQLDLSITIDSLIVTDSFAVAYGYTLGHVLSKTDSSAKEIRDRYTMLLRRADTEWEITRLMWSPE